MRLGALEAGGTKMVCAIGNANGETPKMTNFHIFCNRLLSFYSTLFLYQNNPVCYM